MNVRLFQSFFVLGILACVVAMAAACRTRGDSPKRQPTENGEVNGSTSLVEVTAVVEEFWPNGYKDELMSSAGRERITDLIRLRVVSPAASNGRIMRLLLDSKNRASSPFQLLTRVGATVRFKVGGRLIGELDNGPIEASMLEGLELAQ